MSRLACPYCMKPVRANPIGRWYAGFLCPHCDGKLQFDRATNAIGMGGSAFFFGMMFAIVMGRTALAHAIAAACGGLWLASLGLSYSLRRVVKRP
ncbi:MAG TPA: hypothetical protein VM122_09265 [Usitatibacter sp.]|nr:hypothetical protein [Usitatibacter sp.]